MIEIEGRAEKRETTILRSINLRINLKSSDTLIKFEELFSNHF